MLLTLYHVVIFGVNAVAITSLNYYTIRRSPLYAKRCTVLWIKIPRTSNQRFTDQWIKNINKAVSLNFILPLTHSITNADSTVINNSITDIVPKFLEENSQSYPPELYNYIQNYEIEKFLGAGKYNTVYSMKKKKVMPPLYSSSTKAAVASSSSPPIVMRVSISSDKIADNVQTRQLYKLREKLFLFLHDNLIVASSNTNAITSNPSRTYADSIKDNNSIRNFLLLSTFIQSIFNQESFYSNAYNKNRSIATTQSILEEQSRQLAFASINNSNKSNNNCSGNKVNDELMQHRRHTLFDINIPINSFSIILNDNFTSNKKWKYSTQIATPLTLHLEFQHRYDGSVDQLAPGELSQVEILRLFYGYWYDQYLFLPNYHMDATLGNIFYSRRPNNNNNAYVGSVANNRSRNHTHNNIISFTWADFGCPRTWNRKSNSKYNITVLYCDWYTSPLTELYDFCQQMLIIPSSSSSSCRVDVEAATTSNINRSKNNYNNNSNNDCYDNERNGETVAVYKSIQELLRQSRVYQLQLCHCNNNDGYRSSVNNESNINNSNTQQQLQDKSCQQQYQTPSPKYFFTSMIRHISKLYPKLLPKETLENVFSCSDNKSSASYNYLEIMNRLASI